MPAPETTVQLQSPLPASLVRGTRTALFCLGTATVDGEPLGRLELLVDGVAQPVAARAMPRFDATPRRSGFWAVVAIHATAGAVVLGARLTTLAGDVAEMELGRIPVLGSAGAPAELPHTAAHPDPDAPITVAMASFNPSRALLKAQIDSLRGQIDQNWRCVISDDASDPERYAELLEVLDGDPRFSVSRSETRLGFYRNFERALTLVPADTALIALCDQDDVWYPEKLSSLRAAIGDAAIAYSDMRLVDSDGRVLSDTLWVKRANNADSLTSLLVAGSITGAAMLMTPDVVAASLPFPDSPGIEFHDHWLSLVGLAWGEVAYVPRPLYDYVQHGEAVVGKHSGGRVRREWRDGLRPRHWRAAYFLAYVPGQVRAQVLLDRCAHRLTPGKRRALERYLACEASLGALAWLALRPLRALWGRNETLGSEWDLAGAILWRRLAGAIAKLRPWPERLLLDCRFPDPPLWRQRRMQRWRSEVTSGSGASGQRS